MALGSSVVYDKTQWGIAASHLNACVDNIWNFELKKSSKRGVKISFWVAGVKDGLSVGKIWLGRESYDGSEGESKLIGGWSSRAEGKKWKALGIVVREDIEDLKQSAFLKRSITVKDAKAGKYRLKFVFGGGNSALAIKKVEIKKL